MKRATRSTATVLAALALAATLLHPLALQAQEQEEHYDVPYVPTPDRVMSQMLRLLDPAPEDTLYDLGSGDGRIVIAAAARHGAHGVGVEIDSGRVALARSNAESAEVDGRVRFIHGDLFEVDISPATMVTLYLLPNVNLRLRPKLFRELRPGTPVVSHDFDMGEWPADSVVKIPQDGSSVYYWVMPADAAGEWEVSAAGERFTLWIEQQFQELVVEVTGAPSAEVRSASLRGRRIRIELAAPEGSPLNGMILSGTVDGGRMSGRAGSSGTWSARRVAEGAPIIGG